MQPRTDDAAWWRLSDRFQPFDDILFPERCDPVGRRQFSHLLDLHRWQTREYVVQVLLRLDAVVFAVLHPVCGICPKIVRKTLVLKM